MQGAALPFMRGIGASNYIPNSDASVATYVDSVYQANAFGGVINMPGTERVEILAGPQGTLYGRNAVGGAINIITLTPSDKVEGMGMLSYGNYDSFEGTARISGPVSDNLRIGIYAAGTSRKTYLNVVSSADPLRTRERAWGMRFKAVWTPSDDVTLTGSIEHQEQKGLEAVAFRQGDPNAIGFLFGAPLQIAPFTVQQNQPSAMDAKMTSATLREEVDLGGMTLLGITGYRRYLKHELTDVDATSADLIAQRVREPDTTFSQELQLISQDDGPFKWIVGGYYFHDKTGWLLESFGPLLAPTFPAPSPAYSNVADVSVRTTSYAAFAQGTYALSEALNLTVGGRYTIDRKRFAATEQYIDPQGNVLAGIAPDGRKTWKAFTPKVTLDYRVGGTLLYGTYSRGFKSGAYNVSSPSTPGPVDPEKVQAVEVGSKSDLFGQRVQFNTAAFYYDFKDIQQLVGNARGQGELQNAASGEIYGVEGNLVARLSSSLTLNAGAIWLIRARFGTFTDFAGKGGNIDVSGNRLTSAPKLSTTAAIDYGRELANGDEIHANAIWRYNSGFFWTPENVARQRAFHIVDASIGYRFGGGKFDLSAWATNLFDAYHVNYVQPVGAIGDLTIDAPPRTYGIRATIHL